MPAVRTISEAAPEPEPDPELEAAPEPVAEPEQLAVSAEAEHKPAAEPLRQNAREPDPEPELQLQPTRQAVAADASTDGLVRGSKMAVYSLSGKKKHDRWFWLQTESSAVICWGKTLHDKKHKSERLVDVVDGPSIRDARTLFDEVDVDQSGELDEQEIARLYKKARGQKLGKKELRAAMQEMDTDRGNGVSFEEFEKWWSVNGGDLEKYRSKALTLVMADGLELLLVAPTVEIHQYWLRGCTALLKQNAPSDRKDNSPSPKEAVLAMEETRHTASPSAGNDDDGKQPQRVLEPEPESEPMTKAQVRDRVRAYLDAQRDRREASDEWIDARFDRFDTDKSGTVDTSEWKNLVQSLEPHIATMTLPPPWGIDMETNRNKALAVVSVQKGSHADNVGIEPGMVLTTVNGARVMQASSGKRMALSAGIPVKLGFDEPEPKKRLSRRQCREMVRIQLEIERRDPNVSDEWIDDIFDTFDADESGFIDEDEWDNIVFHLASHPHPSSVEALAAQPSPLTSEQLVKSPAGSEEHLMNPSLSIEVEAACSQKHVSSVPGECQQNVELYIDEREGLADADSTDAKTEPQTPPVTRPGRSFSQTERQNERAEQLRESRSSRERPDSTSRWSLPVGALVAARATEATLHAAAATGHPVGRPESTSEEVLVPAVLPPPSISCNIRRRSLGPKSTPPKHRLPVPTKLEPGDDAVSLSPRAVATASVDSKSEESVLSSFKEVSPSAVASDGSAFVTRELAEAKAAQLRVEGDSAAKQGDLQVAREKYKVAARLVEASSPLGVELRRQLAEESSEGQSAEPSTSPNSKGDSNRAGLARRRTPRRLEMQTAPQLDHYMQNRMVGSTPRRSPTSTGMLAPPSSSVSHNEADNYSEASSDSHVSISDSPVEPPAVSAHHHAGETSVLFTPGATAAKCDAAAAAVVSARQGRKQALEQQQTPNGSTTLPQLRGLSTSSQLSSMDNNPVPDKRADAHSPSQLRQVEENLEQRIHMLHRLVHTVTAAVDICHVLGC